MNIQANIKLFSKSDITKTCDITHYKTDILTLIDKNELCEITEEEMVRCDSYVVLVSDKAEAIYDYTGSMYDYYSRYRRIDKFFKHHIYKFVNEELQITNEKTDEATETSSVNYYVKYVNEITDVELHRLIANDVDYGDAEF
jgi:hypothetical protein